MPTLYYKNVSGNDWATPGNWFTNITATSSAGTILAATAPWLANNVFKTYDLEFATGVTVSPRIGYAAGSESIGNGFDITGTCSIPVIFGFPFQDSEGYSYVYGGNYSAPVTGFFAFINGGTFQSTVISTNSLEILSGTFQGAVSNSNNTIIISNGVFQSTVTLTNYASITNGTFNGAVTINVNTGGTPVGGGTFNSSFTQTFGTVAGGTFNGTYNYVAGNVTGGNFNNGIINQFYRNGFPPGAFVFGGYNSKALDVLGTGLV